MTMAASLEEERGKFFSGEVDFEVPVGICVKYCYLPTYNNFIFPSY